MTQTAEPGVEALRADVAGPVLLPGDAGFDEARSLWNGAFDRRPALVVRCTSPGDVVAALAHARERGLRVTVRGGGHATAGTAAEDGALMIDLSALRSVAVDPVGRRARVGGGATLADVDAATQEHGLAVPAGKISNTGVGGLTLGGGMGWLTRRHGLTIDSLESVEVVTADGRVLRASATAHPDLFWAVRGGGGNFGVVTEFEYRLHAVGPVVEVGMFFYDLDRVGDLLRLDRELTVDLPRDLTILVSGINAPPAPFVPLALHFRPVAVLVAVGYGPAGQHAALLDRIRAAVPALAEVATPMPYTALQQMLDGSAPWGAHCYEKAIFVDDLTEDVVAAVEEHLPRKTSPLSLLHFYALSGAYGDVADDATAFGGRRAARYGVFVVGLTTEAGALDAERTWVRDTWAALHALDGSAGGYVNGLTDWDDDERVRAVYGAKYDRLAGIKAVYDPTNVFRANANIRPA